MTSIESKFKSIRKFCKDNANEDNVKKYAKYFTEGFDAYGVGREEFEIELDRLLKAWENEMTLDDYFDLGDVLISTGKYEEASFALYLTYNKPELLKKKHFARYGKWFDGGIVNWGHTDVLSALGLAPFFFNNLLKISAFKQWTKSSNKWKRRAVPVTFVELVKKDFNVNEMLQIIEPIMNDEEKKVQQGLGWFLREAWKLYPEIIEEFMLKWKETCGRTIIQYATEKMSKEERIKFRKTKKSNRKDK